MLLSPKCQTEMFLYNQTDCITVHAFRTTMQIFDLLSNTSMSYNEKKYTLNNWELVSSDPHFCNHAVSQLTTMSGQQRQTIHKPSTATYWQDTEVTSP